MNMQIIKIALPFAVTLFLLTTLTLAFEQPEQGNVGTPPIEQAVVREGSFAVKLDAALGLGATNDETEAESNLGALGIAPRNGWIADYPVTPDIMGELRKAVSDAVDSGLLTLRKDDALKRLDDVAADFGLAVIPYTATGNGAPVPEDATPYPDQADISAYYYDEGPPVVTYFTPPPDYYSLYAWVPFPFWCTGFWFPGYFILNDFHRPFFFGNHLALVSNHFNDFRAHRVFRIDPVARFSGRTYAGIGAPRGNFLSTGVRGNTGNVFNAQRSGALGTGSPGSPAFTGSRFHRNGVTGPARSVGMQSAGSQRAISPATGNTSLRIPSGWSRSGIGHPSGASRSFTTPSGIVGIHGVPNTAYRSFASPSGTRSYGYHSGSVRSFGLPSGGGAHSAPSFGGGRSFTPSHGGVRSFSMPSAGALHSAPSFGGGGSFTPSHGGVRSFSVPSAGAVHSAPSFGGGRSFSAPSAGGGGFGRGGRR